MLLLLHLSCYGFMFHLQSAYQNFHFSATAFLYVQDVQVLASLDTGHSTPLYLLDLSAAFDRINHSTLTHHLQQ